MQCPLNEHHFIPRNSLEQHMHKCQYAAQGVQSGIEVCYHSLTKLRSQGEPGSEANSASYSPIVPHGHNIKITCTLTKWVRVVDLCSMFIVETQNS